MYLYINTRNSSLEDLYKAVGGKPPSVPSVSVPAAPAAPAAPSAPTAPKPPTAGGGELKSPGMIGGKQLVDCPLGESCDKGGKHIAGSKTFQKHAKLAANKAAMSRATARKEAKEKKKAAKEGSKVAGAEEGLTPAAEPPKPEKENLGGVGSDEAKAPEAKAAEPTAQPTPAAPEALSARAARRKMMGKPLSPAEAMALEFSQPEQVAAREEADIHLAKLAEESASRAATQKIEGAKERGRQKFVKDVPVSEFEKEQGPLEHYRLSRVAREAGDRETAAKQEALARKKTQTLSSAEHKDLSDKLKREGDSKNAGYHDTIHNMVSGFMSRDEALATNDRLQQQIETDNNTLEGYSAVEPSELRSEELATTDEAARSKFAEARQTNEETAQQAQLLKLKDKLKNVEQLRESGGSEGERAAAEVVAGRLKEKISGMEGERPAEMTQKMERQAAETAAKETTQEALATNLSTKDKAKQTKLESRLSGAKAQLESAKQSGDKRAISQAENRVNRLSENLETHKKEAAVRAGGEAVPPTEPKESIDLKDGTQPIPLTQRKEEQPAAQQAAEEAAPADAIAAATATHSERGKNSMKEAEAAHEASKAAAAAVGARNASKLEEHSKAVNEWEAGGKKGKKPKKPKLEAQPQVSEKPKLKKPESDVEKLKHSTHQAAAAKQAEAIESHLRNNPSLSADEKQRLELAHKASVYNANIAHVPTAENRAEMSAAGSTAKQIGAHEHWDDVKAKQDAQTTAASAAADAKEQKEKAKATAKEQKETAKATAKEQKEKAKTEAKEKEAAAKAAPREIESDLDRIKAEGHRSTAQNLREKIQSHMDNNANLSDSDREHGQRLLAELKEHEELGKVPGSDHSERLRAVRSNMGVFAKPHKEPAPDKAETQKPAKGEGMLQFLARRAKQGAAAGAALGSAVASPGGAGSVGTRLVNYGVSGAFGAGHQLLSGSGGSSDKAADEDKNAKTAEDQQAEAAGAEPETAAESPAEPESPDVAAEQERAAETASRSAIESEAAAAGSRSPGVFRPRERMPEASVTSAPAPANESEASASPTSTGAAGGPLKISQEDLSGPGRRSLLRSLSNQTLYITI